MSQHDFLLDNQSAPAFRADANAALQALASNNAGPNEPPTKVACMWWADTTAGLLKQRSADNTQWVVRGTLAAETVVARGSDTTLVAADFGKRIVATGSWSQTLAAAATLGLGWWVDYRNDGTGTVTIDPSGGEVIDGAATLALGPGEACKIVCDGTRFLLYNRERRAASQAEMQSGTEAGMREMSPALVKAAILALGKSGGSPVRQTVLSGPVDANGYPNFLPATSATLSLSTQNISASTPLIVTSAAGFTAAGADDRIGVAVANFVWPGLAANSTNILFVDVGVDGSLTPVIAILPVIYQFGGARSTANGQSTFNYGPAEMSMTVGNGSSAVAVRRVCVGEADTNATGVVATRAYAYQGTFESQETAISASAVTVFGHSIGDVPKNVDVVLRCKTAEHGYLVGDEAWFKTRPSAVESSIHTPVSRNRLFAYLTLSSLIHVHSRTTLDHVVIDPAKWRVVVRAKRW